MQSGLNFTLPWIWFAPAVGSSMNDPIDAKRPSQLDAARRIPPSSGRGQGPDRSDSIAAAPDPARLLVEEDYFRIVLFGLLDPAFDSMRGPRATSKITEVPGDVSSRPVSFGGFSEAQSVFEPGLLKVVVLELSSGMGCNWGDPLLTHLADVSSLSETLLPGLLRLRRALWLDDQSCAARCTSPPRSCPPSRRRKCSAR